MNITKVSDSIEDNPYKNKDSSVVLKKIYDANEYLEVNEASVSSVKRSFIEQMVKEANDGVYQNGSSIKNLSGEEINTYCEHIDKALSTEAIEPGRYTVPINIKNSKLWEDSATVEIKETGTGIEMTITLTSLNSGETKSLSVPYYSETTIISEGIEFLLDFSLAELSSANLVDLRNTIAKAYEQLQNGTVYTAESSETLKYEIEKSEELLTNLDAEQSEVDAQTELLKKAIDGLKERHLTTN